MDVVEFRWSVGDEIDGQDVSATCLEADTDSSGFPVAAILNGAKESGGNRGGGDSRSAGQRFSLYAFLESAYLKAAVRKPLHKIDVRSFRSKGFVPT